MSGTPPDWFQIRLAAALLRAGGVVAHATEAVWGFACVPFFHAPVERIAAIKARGLHKGLIVIIAEAALAEPALARLGAAQRRRVLESWPGANTWVVPNFGFSGWITGGTDRVAVRVPGHDQARRLCAAAGGYLVSTSANVSRQPPARTVLQVQQRFAGQVDYVLPGRVAGLAAPSSIRDACSDTLLRAGG